MISSDIGKAKSNDRTNILPTFQSSYDVGDGKELTKELADSIAKLKFLRKDLDHVYNKK